jgi:hypothetical protein
MTEQAKSLTAGGYNFRPLFGGSPFFREAAKRAEERRACVRARSLAKAAGQSQPTRRG